MKDNHLRYIVETKGEMRDRFAQSLACQRAWSDWAAARDTPIVPITRPSSATLAHRKERGAAVVQSGLAVGSGIDPDARRPRSAAASRRLRMTPGLQFHSAANKRDPLSHIMRSTGGPAQTAFSTASSASEHSASALQSGYGELPAAIAALRETYQDNVAGLVPTPRHVGQTTEDRTKHAASAASHAFVALEVLSCVLQRANSSAAGSPLVQVGQLIDELLPVLHRNTFVDAASLLTVHGREAACRAAVERDSLAYWTAVRQKDYAKLHTYRSAAGTWQHAQVPLLGTTAFRSQQQQQHRGLSRSAAAGSAAVRVQGSACSAFVTRMAEKRKAFRSWRDIARRVVGARKRAEGMRRAGRRLRLAGSFEHWRLRVTQSLLARRTADVVAFGRAMQTDLQKLDRASGLLRDRTANSSALQQEVYALQGELGRAREALADLQCPMVFDFRSAIVDHTTGKPIESGIIHFRECTDAEERNADLTLFRDWSRPRRREGVAQPHRLRIDRSHYVIRVDPVLPPEPPLLRWVNDAALAYATEITRRPTFNANFTWQTAMVAARRVFDDQLREFQAQAAVRAAAARECDQRNTCVLQVEPTPEFALKSVSDLARWPGVALACALRTAPEATTAAQSAIAHKRMQDGTLDRSEDMVVQFGSMADLHELLCELGCAQGMPLAEFAAPTDPQPETLLELALTRLWAYTALNAAVERDEKRRGAAVLPQPRASLPQVAQILAGRHPPARGVSGVLRVSPVRSLLSLVSQRSGDDFTEDGSADEVLQWLRDVLLDSQKAAQPTASSSLDVTSPSDRRSRRRMHSIPTVTARGDRVAINIRNVDEDLSGGLDLLVNFIQHIAGVSHVPVIEPVAAEASSTRRPSDPLGATGGGNETPPPQPGSPRSDARWKRNAVLAKYLCKTASEELYAHIPHVVWEKLWTSKPSARLLYLSAVYNAIHSASKPAVPKGGQEADAGPNAFSPARIGRRMSNPRIPSSATVDSLTESALSAVKTYAGSVGPVPPPELSGSRLIPIFGKPGPFHAVCRAFAKVWPIYFVAFVRYYLLHGSPSTDPAESGAASAEGAQSSMTLGLAPLVRLAIEWNFFACFSGSDPGKLRLAIVRAFCECCDEEAKAVLPAASSETFSPPDNWIQTLSVGQLSHLELNVLRLGEFAIRVACGSPAGQDKPAMREWQESNFYRVETMLKTFCQFIVSNAGIWNSAQQQTQCADLLCNSEMPFRIFALCDPRDFRNKVFAPDVIKVLRSYQDLLIKLFARFSLFTSEATWKLLEQREMTLGLFMSFVQTYKITAPSHLGARRGSRAPVDIVRAKLSDVMCARAFLVVASARNGLRDVAARPVFKVPASSVPAQSAVPESRALKVAQKTIIHVAAPDTLAFSGFCELFVALAACAIPAPWISLPDRVEMLLCHCQAQDDPDSAAHS